MAVKSVDAEKETSSDEQPTQEQLIAQLEELKTSMEHYRTQFESVKEEATTWKSKFDDAISTRDKAKQKARAAEDSAAYALELEKERDTLREQLDGIKKQQVKSQKLQTVAKIAKEQGLKDTYIGMIERFVDLDAVDAEKEVSVKHEVNKLKSSMPDLFGSPSVASRAFASPSLSTGVNYKDELAKEMDKPRGQRNVKRILELEELAKQS